MNNKVTIEQQEEMGLRRQANNFVQPPPKMEVLPPRPSIQSLDTNATLTIDMVPNATSHIEVRTSFWDRAKGFSLVTSQLSIIYGIAFVIVGKAVADIPIFSLWGALMFVIAYSITWGIAYSQTLHYSPEGIQARESDKKLSIIEMDVRKRWEMLERDQAEAIRERREDRQEARQRRLGGK